MAEKTPQELIQIDLAPPPRNWMNPAIDFEARRGTWSYPAAVKNLKYLGQPNPRDWSPADASPPSCATCSCPTSPARSKRCT